MSDDMRAGLSNVRVGVSGWTYDGWRGHFYPLGLPHKAELAFASHRFNSLEINGTFYSLQRPSSYTAWHDAAPQDFVYAVKGSKFITHMKRLKDVQEPLANFFAQGVLGLGSKLGPILWQLPANFRFDIERISSFLQLLPTTAAAAVELANSHVNPDLVSKGKTMTQLPTTLSPETRLRYAMEVRHDSFHCQEFYQLLNYHNVACVVADTAQHFPLLQQVDCADLLYIRLHGSKELYHSQYTDQELQQWADNICSWASISPPHQTTPLLTATATTAAAARTTKASTAPAAAVLSSDGAVALNASHTSSAHSTRSSKDVFVYFDNTDSGWAPFDAMNLLQKLTGSQPAPVEQVVEQLGIKLHSKGSKVRNRSQQQIADVKLQYGMHQQHQNQAAAWQLQEELLAAARDPSTDSTSKPQQPKATKWGRPRQAKRSRNHVT